MNQLGHINWQSDMGRPDYLAARLYASPPMPIFHRRLLTAALRAEAAHRLRAAGKTESEVNAAFESVAANGGIDEAFRTAGLAADAADLAVGGNFGSHPILDAVGAWLRSPEGKAVLAAFLKLLLAAIV